MGFELTFRLLKSRNDDNRPPSWPANLLQDLARYVFQTGNRLCAGDNIPWGKSLNLNLPASKIRHMLIVEDPQMPRTQTPFGFVDFLQIVGATADEVEKASQWSGKGVLNLLKSDPVTGGEWLITDMLRTKSVFELFPEKLRQLEANLAEEGSTLAGVNAEFEFKETQGAYIKKEIESSEQGELVAGTENNQNSNNWTDNDNELMIKKEVQIGDMQCPVDYPNVPFRATTFSGLEIKFAPYAAKFLMLAIRDRVRHGRHFTFKGPKYAITFVAESVTGSNCNKTNPYVVVGYWIQVLVCNDLVNRMVEDFKCIDGIDIDPTRLPITFDFPDKNLKFIVDNFAVQQQTPFLP